MTGWEMVLVAGMALVTVAVRYPVLALVSRIPLPTGLLAALKYVPPAVLSAIIAPALLAPGDGALQISWTNDALVAGLIAALLAWRTGNLLLTILLGMSSLWAWRWLLAAGWLG
jgi:branched-subunit amino acid transport protein